MIVGLVGKRQSGKNTVARYLQLRYGFTPLAFAATLKGFCFLTFKNPLVWRPELSPEARKTLQVIGDLGRQHHERLFVDTAVNLLPLNFRDRIVVTDVRFKNEAEFVRERGFLIKLVRDNKAQLPQIDNHPSETEVDEITTDYTVNMNTPLSQVFKRVDEIMRCAGIDPRPRQPAVFVSSNVWGHKGCEKIFACFAEKLSEEGFMPINPMELTSWADYLRVLLREHRPFKNACEWLLSKNMVALRDADAVLVIPYNTSFGVAAEAQTAYMLNIPVVVTLAQDTPFPANAEIACHPYLVVWSEGRIFATLAEALYCLKELLGLV